MKKLFCTVALALAVFGGASAETLDREVSLFQTTRSNLKNIATALEMWAADHKGQYPPSLQPLESDYLLKIPPQVDGSTGWNYRVDGNHFQLSDSWNGFARLGMPATIKYDNDAGISGGALAPELAVFGNSIQLKGRWISSRGNSGLSASWERFGTRISARLCGPQTCDESFAQQVERMTSSCPRWGWKADEGEFAQRLEQAGTNGWKVAGVFYSAGEPWHRMLLVTKGERLIEVTVEDHENRDPLGKLAEVQSLLAQF